MTDLEQIAEQQADECCKRFFDIGLTDPATIELVKVVYKLGFMVGGNEALRRAFKDKNEEQS